MMPIFDDTVLAVGNEAFYRRDFIQVLDSHLEYLKTAGNVQRLEIPTAMLGNYRGDYYAVLWGLNIPLQYHRIIMHVNGYHSPTDYSGDPGTVLVPDLAVIDALLGVYDTGSSALTRSLN